MLSLYDICFQNIVLLIIDGLLLSVNIFIIDEKSLYIILSYLLGLYFLNGQYNEFSNIGLYLNDTYYVCIVYSLDGYHMFHVLFGDILLAFIICHLGNSK